MRVHTDYLWFKTKQRQEFVRITDDVAAIVAASGVRRRHGARVRDAHHRCGVRERLGGRPHLRFPVVAREARAGRDCRIGITRPARTTPMRISSARSWAIR